MVFLNRCLKSQDGVSFNINTMDNRMHKLKIREEIYLLQT